MTVEELIAQLLRLPAEAQQAPVFIDTDRKYRGTDYIVYTMPVSVEADLDDSPCVVIRSEEADLPA